MKRRRGAVNTGNGSSRCLVWLRSTRKISLTDRVKIPGRKSAQNSFEQRSASVKALNDSVTYLRFGEREQQQNHEKV